MGHAYLEALPLQIARNHVGQGRFGLNIVAGWNEGEFEMFGVEQREHEQRYEYAQEWIDAIKMAWATNEDFDFDGQYIRLKSVRAKPKPYGGTRPVIMNAGSSGTGEAFAFGEGVALPTRMKFRQLPPHLVPKSETVTAGDGAAATDNHSLASVVDRWRGRVAKPRGART